MPPFLKREEEGEATAAALSSLFCVVIIGPSTALHTHTLLWYVVSVMEGKEKEE